MVNALLGFRAALLFDGNPLITLTRTQQYLRWGTGLCGGRERINQHQQHERLRNPATGAL
jgi:hypothetical protein